MKKRIMFTVKCDEKQIDIEVDPDINTLDLTMVLVERFELVNVDVVLFSENKNSQLNNESSLFEENILTGDILHLVE